MKKEREPIQLPPNFKPKNRFNFSLEDYCMPEIRFLNQCINVTQAEVCGERTNCIYETSGKKKIGPKLLSKSPSENKFFLTQSNKKANEYKNIFDSCENQKTNLKKQQEAIKIRSGQVLEKHRYSTKSSSSDIQKYLFSSESEYYDLPPKEEAKAQENDEKRIERPSANRNLFLKSKQPNLHNLHNLHNLEKSINLDLGEFYLRGNNP